MIHPFKKPISKSTFYSDLTLIGEIEQQEGYQLSLEEDGVSRLNRTCSTVKSWLCGYPLNLWQNVFVKLFLNS